MSERLHLPEEYAALCEVMPFRTTQAELQKLFEKGKTLCWTFNAENWNVRVWYREGDSSVSDGSGHLEVDGQAYFNGTVGYISENSFTLHQQINVELPCPIKSVEIAIRKYLNP